MKKNVASFFCVAIIVAVVFASIFATQSIRFFTKAECCMVSKQLWYYDPFLIT